MPSRRFFRWTRLRIGLLAGALPLLAASLGFGQQVDPPRNLVASLAQLPGLAEGPDKGAFVELVRAMAEIYPGRIRIEVYPFARSFRNMEAGLADFHIPAMRNPEIPADKLAYRYVSEKIGSVALVLYSRSDKPVTRKDVYRALEQGGPFPYVIEVSAGAEANCAFPAKPTNHFEQSLKKLSDGRIDAIWNAQEETDLVLKRLKLKNIHRSFWGNFDDVIAIRKGPENDALDRTLSGLLRQLRSSGRLGEIYRKVHAPYVEWQPATEGW